MRKHIVQYGNESTPAEREALGMTEAEDDHFAAAAINSRQTGIDKSRGVHHIYSYLESRVEINKEMVLCAMSTTH